MTFLSRVNRARCACLLGTLAGIAATARADVYILLLNTGTSSATYSLSVTAPFQTTPSGASNIIGSYSDTNPTGTKTIPGLFGGNTNTNQPIPISSGSVSATGSSGSSPLHPAGSLVIIPDVTAGTIRAADLALDLLHGSAASVAASASITYPSFRTRQPTCTLLGIPLTVPVGNGEVTALTASQIDEDDAGTLTPSGPGQYTFSIPMNVAVNGSADFNGADIPIDTQTIPIILTGTLTLAGNSATLTGAFDVDRAQSEPGPITLDPLAFTEPLCGGNLLIDLVLSETDVNLSTHVSMQATGRTTGSSCDPDVNQDGNADQDDVTYLVSVIAGGPNTTAIDPDFNRDGNVDQDDITALVNVIAGGNCP